MIMDVAERAGDNTECEADTSGGAPPVVLVIVLSGLYVCVASV